VTEGIAKEELGQRIQSGWIHAGRQAVNTASGILDPSKPMSPTGVVDVDVWILPEPMIPAGLIATVLAQAYKVENDVRPKTLLLDDIARALFGGMGILPLIEELEKQPSAAESKEEPENER